MWGRLDIMVSNARWERVAPITALDPEDWDRTHAVHLRSHYLAAKYAIPVMAAQGQGCLISISSVQGLGVSPQHAAYCSAKAAVNQLVRQIADEFGPQGIRANAILPGSVVTHRTAAAWREHPELKERSRRLHPAGRPVTPRDIANLAVFMASDDSSMITGQSIVIDGGLTLALAPIVASRVLDPK